MALVIAPIMEIMEQITITTDVSYSESEFNACLASLPPGFGSSVAKRLISAVAIDARQYGAWKELAAEIAPHYASRKELLGEDNQIALKELVLLGLSPAFNEAYALDKKALPSSRHRTEEQQAAT